MKSDLEIIQLLTDCSKSLWWTSEVDTLWKVFHWPPAPIEVLAVLEMLQLSADVVWDECSLEEFFHSVAADPGYVLLINVLYENLFDLRVFLVGEVEISVYIVGHSPSGDRIGLTTQIVET
jgi:Nuclease A inhibitor-like protein